VFEHLRKPVRHPLDPFYIPDPPAPAIRPPLKESLAWFPDDLEQQASLLVVVIVGGFEGAVPSSDGNAEVLSQLAQATLGSAGMTDEAAD